MYGAHIQAIAQLQSIINVSMSDKRKLNVTLLCLETDRRHFSCNFSKRCLMLIIFGRS